MKVVDLRITVDGLLLKDDESVEEYINKIAGMTDSRYPLQYEIIYEEKE